ncbi:MAG TPA: SDR family oxidoreductase [Streptosporangiaceae bacterium]
MRVFVTGATGFIGSAVVQELLGSGHEVVGLARSDASTAALATTGAEVVRGTLQDIDILQDAARRADGVVHTGYIHDFSPAGNPAAAAAVDEAAITAFADALEGTGKPLVVAAGLPPKPGVLVTEDDRAPDNPPYPRFSEPAALAAAGRGVRASVVRMPPSVHGEGDPNFITALIGIARATGLSAYVGEGTNVWSAVHRLDAARLFRIALEQAPAGALLNAVGDEGVPFRQIAEVIGAHLNVPVKSISAEEATGQFGLPFAIFAQFDSPAASARTQQRYGWQPAEPGLVADLEQGHYFTASGGEPTA